LGYFPFDDEAYPPLSHWLTLSLVIQRSYLDGSLQITKSYKNVSSIHHSQIEEDSFRWKVGSLHEILAPNSMQKQATNGTKTRSFWSKIEPSKISTIHQ
jgi:hypothetical protein